MRKKILIFTGAGVSAESGVDTFRDTGGLWCNHKIEDVATPTGWRKNKEVVLEFYNQRREQLKTVVPNDAHKIISELEEYFDVTVVTQNVDDLHERSGSTNVVHLHGELTKVRGCLYEHKTSELDIVYDIGYEPTKLGDKCEVTNSQLRPHIVWFGEELNYLDVNKSVLAAEEADVCVVVGTSMQVAPANTIPFLTKEKTLIYYVDPGDKFEISGLRELYFKHFQEKAGSGMKKVKDDLIGLFINNEEDIRTKPII